jgi:hypothetical protein
MIQLHFDIAGNFLLVEIPSSLGFHDAISPDVAPVSL